MRRIHVEDSLSLRFPGRDDSFTEGVEVGLILAQMASGRREFTGRVASRTVEQARALAERMGYRVHVVRDDEDVAEVMFLTGARRPSLRLVHGAGQRAG